MKNWTLYRAIKESKYQTLKGFALVIGVSGTYVGMVVNGKTELSDKKKTEWAKYLGTTVDYLWPETVNV